MYFWANKKFIIKYYYITIMYLVNSAKSSKSIFEFLFVPVIIGFFLKTQGRPNAPLDFVKGGGGGGTSRVRGL